MSKSFQMFKKRCGKVIITAGLIVATTVSVYADNTALANANVETGTKTKVEKVLGQDSKITIKVGKVKSIYDKVLGEKEYQSYLLQKGII